MLSIGNVSYNFLREIWRAGKLDGYYPVANNFDFTAYEPVDESLRRCATDLATSSLRDLSRNQTVLKCWHINGSERKLTDHQVLYRSGYR